MKLFQSNLWTTLSTVHSELNHLAAILHVYAGGLIYIYEVKKNIIFQKEKVNTFKLLIIFVVKSLQKEQNSTNPPNLPE